MDLRGIRDYGERFLAAVLNDSNSPILITDARALDNPIVFVNPAFEHATGYSFEEVIGRNCRFLQNQDRQQPGRTIIAEAIRTGTPCDVLLRNYRKNGQMFWVRIYMFPVTDGEGNISHFVGVQHDVTAETELSRTLKERQVFIDTSPDVYLKITSDMTIMQVNGAYEAIFGSQACKLIGENFATYFMTERTAEAQAKLETLLLADEPMSVEAEYFSRAGHKFVMEWSEVQTETADEILLVGRDVTARKDAQRDAIRANSQMAAILNRITEGCFSLDREWRCTYMNAKAGEWLNRDPDELVGKILWDECNR